jgi:hypothetical protein
MHRIRNASPLAAALLLALTLLLPTPSSALPDGDSIARDLLEEGFENLFVEEREGLVTVWFENRVYRHELTAIGVAALVAAEGLEDAVILELIPENRGVPLLSLSAPAGAWRAFLRGEIGEAEFESRLTILLGKRIEGSTLRHSGARWPGWQGRNPSHLRTDFALRPLFNFRLGQFTDTFLYTLQVGPEATMSPFYGGLVTLQAAVRIHDDQDPCHSFGGACRAAVHPVRNTLSWGGWLPGNWLLASSAGIFPGDRYGFLTEVGTLVLDGRLELWAGGEATGGIRFLEEEEADGGSFLWDLITYTNVADWSAFAAATYRPLGIDLEGTLTMGRFREGKSGVRVDLQRRLGEFELGFFVIHQIDADLLETADPRRDDKEETVGGVTLRIPLPVRRYPSPSRFRATTVPAFPFTYWESTAPVGVQTSMFDNLDRLRKRLYPPYIRNNLTDLRTANRHVEAGR